MGDAGEEQDGEVDEAPGVEEWIADESRDDEVAEGCRPDCIQGVAPPRLRGVVRRISVAAGAPYPVACGWRRHIAEVVGQRRRRATPG